MSAFSQNIELAGLTSITTSIPTAGVYLVQGKLQLPTLINGGGASQAVTTITQNSTTVYTGLAGAEGFKTVINAAALDTVTVAVTSSATPDLGLNVVKTAVSIG